MITPRKKLLTTLENTPAFPHSAHEVLKLTSNIACSPRELVNVVDRDPVLALNLLKVVNSPYFGLSNTVSSIQQAVVYVGINTLKNLALRVVSANVLQHSHIHSDRLDPTLHALLLHATTTAVIARRIASRMGMAERVAADCFVGGLLHDYGQIVFAQTYPKQFRRIFKKAHKNETPILQMEREAFGMSHTELGADLGTRWHLPEELVACMRDHHVRDAPIPSDIHDCVYTANLLAAKINVGYHGGGGGYHDGGGDAMSLPESVVQRVGETVSDIQRNIGDISEEIAKMRLFR